MIVLQASHIAKQFDGHDVLFDASLVVKSGDRVALVGPNGAGKSTLLKIAVGELSADTGDVSLAKDASLGYVSQFVITEETTTIFEYVADSFREVYALEDKIRDTAEKMANPSIYEDERQFRALSEAYDRLQKEFEELGGYAVEARIRKVLDGLNFPTEMHPRQIGTLSGGQKTRLSLARLLASEPTILVLDEPTNYLDTDTITWLEGYLEGYSGAILLVSHDRYFLDKVATVIYEMEDGRTTRYVGNYSDYLDEKAARLEGDTKRWEQQQKEIAKMETFIQKNIVRATTTKRAQSRRKMLDRIVRLEKPSANTPKMALRFTCKRTSGKDVLHVEGLTLGYPGKRLAGPIDLYVARGQRIAMIGPNGIGKTTFLKAIQSGADSKDVPQTTGIRWGTNVDIGYYDQEQTNLVKTKTVLDLIHDEYPELDLTTVRTALGRFLFRGEEITKPVGALSGGERSRLALCRLMLTESNVLILDEPTNHLDLLSKEVLEDSLVDYEGTLIFVSHDRYFIDALATHVMVLNESGFTTYIGNYTEYQQKKMEDEKWSDTATVPSQAVKVSGKVEKKSAVENEPQPATEGKRHVRSADLRKLREKVEQLETSIAENEERQSEIHVEMSDASVIQDVQRTLALNQELEDLVAKHAELLEDWETKAAELEELEELSK